ncbi:hypothetical protein [Flavobacterium sp. SM2513]|uniref:hypothetical protein n=1 Tax=Flavobacterium sp. SM2513 TaxID=3424766 RepID=UPI003D7F62C9
MKWTHIIKNKVLASVALLSLCLLVLASNYIDRKHTDDVKMTISTLYEDRLIAEVYILRMTSSLYEIKEAIQIDVDATDKDVRISNYLAIIKETSDSYLKTKFTELETLKAKELMQILKNFEMHSLNHSPIALHKVDEALVLLNDLSAIQLAESKEIMNYAEKLYLAGKTSSQFVVALIIIILIVLQAIVFSSKTIIIKHQPKSPSLN